MQRSIRVVLKVSRKPSEASTLQTMNPIKKKLVRLLERMLMLVLVLVLPRVLALALVRALELAQVRVLVLVQIQVPMRGLRFGRGL